MKKFVQNYSAMVRREMAFSSNRNHKPYQSDEPQIGQVSIAMTGVKNEKQEIISNESSLEALSSDKITKEDSVNPRSKYWSIFATGAGLFSDGYMGNCGGFLITIIETIYPESAFADSKITVYLGASTFIGVVVGMLVLGWVSDLTSRKSVMIGSTIIIILFSILSAGSWGAGMPSSPIRMLEMLVTVRAIQGFGVGGELAGSVACAEISQSLAHGTRNRWFIWFNNFMIDSGYVACAVINWVLMYICGVPSFATASNSHGLQTAWRVLLGLGAIPPLALLYLRLKFKDSDQFNNNNFKKRKTPWLLIIKRYGPRLALVSLLWFIYDFMGYFYSTYSSLIIKSQVPKNTDGVSNIKSTFGWSIVFNLFYLPGSFVGGLFSDLIGPRLTLVVGVGLQAIIGFIMGAKYSVIKRHIAPFVILYGIFQTLGEFGPGDNIGMMCSKSSASAIRGRYNGIAAAIGKIGAFLGTLAFPLIADHFGGIQTEYGQKVVIYISSSLCVLSALLALCIPELSQEAIAIEDIKFRNYLAENGFDTDDWH